MGRRISPMIFCRSGLAWTKCRPRHILLAQFPARVRGKLLDRLYSTMIHSPKTSSHWTPLVEKSAEHRRESSGCQNLHGPRATGFLRISPSSMVSQRVQLSVSPETGREPGSSTTCRTIQRRMSYPPDRRLFLLIDELLLSPGWSKRERNEDEAMRVRHCLARKI